MKKGKINALINQEDFMWFSIEVDSLILQRFNNILSGIDEKFGDNDYGSGYLQHIDFYEEHIPFKLILRCDGEVYGIIFFNKKEVEFIIFKNNPRFNFVSDLMRKNFDYFYSF